MGFYRKFGMGFFFNGIGPRVIRGSLNNGLFFTIYEGLKRHNVLSRK